VAYTLATISAGVKPGTHTVNVSAYLTCEPLIQRVEELCLVSLFVAVICYNTLQQC